MTYNLYKWYVLFMTTSISSSSFRSEMSRYLEIAQREPVAILSRGTRPRAILVSPEFFEAAMEAMEDRADLLAAAKAREIGGSISHANLKAELGLE